MNTRFITYLNEINMTETLQNRVETMYDIFNEMCDEDIDDIFVTNYVEDDGTMVYENLWFFSDKYIMEAKNFPTLCDLDITPIKNHINYWNIKMQKYDYQNATPTSRFFLTFRLNTMTDADFKSAGMNCSYLKCIIKKYVIPNQIELV